MGRVDDLEREVAELRTRLSRLSEASLRINESLDFETVLQGVLDSARSLTGATYGVAILLGDAGDVEHVLVTGMDEDEATGLRHIPGAADIFERISAIPHAQRMADFPAQMRAWGLPDFRWPIQLSDAPAFLAAPIRPRRRDRRQLLLPGEAGARGVHRGGRGDSRHIRVGGGARHRQRSHVPRGAARSCRPRGAHQHRSRRSHGARHQYRGGPVGQSRGEEDRRGPADGLRLRGGPSRRPDRPAGGRAGVLVRRLLEGCPCSGRDPAGRGDGRDGPPTGEASPRWSMPRRSTTRRATSTPTSSRSRTSGP